jgi:hypothetical protein
MFMGVWLHSHVVGYIPRNRTKGEKWTHWKIVVTRERYNDCAPQNIDIHFFDARKKNKKWTWGKKCQFQHIVQLGSLNDPDVRQRLRTNDDQGPVVNNPRVIAELTAAVEQIERYGSECAKKKKPIEMWRLSQLITQVCLKEPLKKVA